MGTDGRNADPLEQVRHWVFTVDGQLVSGDRLTDYLNNATYNFLNPRATLDGDAVLNLVLVTPDGEFFRRRIRGISRRELISQAQAFMRAVSNPRSSTAYLKPAQYLYNAIIAPIEDTLGTKNISNLTFMEKQ